MKILTFSIVCFASVVVADDFKTVNGKEYKDATITRVEPDGVVIKQKSGISKVYFAELPKEVQERFHYDPAKAAQFNAAEQAAIAQSNDKAQQEAGAKEKAMAVQRKRQSAEELHLEVTEVLPDGILADPLKREEHVGSGAVASRLGRVGGGGGVYAPPGGDVSVSYEPSGKTIFVQGVRGFAEGNRLQVQAYRDGTYTHEGRTVEKWVAVQ